MAIFGRNTARQRLRRATRESLKIPAFSSPVDCTPWVTGGLWPAELSTVTTATAPLVKYLKADLQKIVNSANEELLGIRRAGLADPMRQTEEARVINGARAFAVRRVESTVRHLRNGTPKLPAEHRPLKPVNGADDTEKTRRFKVAAVAPTTTDLPAPPRPEYPDQDHRPAAAAPPPPAADLESVEPERSAPRHRAEPDDTEVLDEIAMVLQEIAPLAEAPVDEAPRQSPAARHTEPRVTPIDEPVSTHQPAPQVESESDRERLERLLKFVARQEPGLRWAVGKRADGSTLLVTDLANGWIPPGITLPADVRLLEPERRAGNAAALLGPTALLATYAPGDALGWAIDYDVADTSSQPRELPAVDDLGWQLSEATHWRDGLPRMVHTLAKAGAAGTGVLDAEIDILRVYLDTSRYQLFAQYPDIDAGLLLNCLLLAATEAIATGNLLTANYHFAWFQMLSTPAASGWKAGP
ncbi:MAG: DUF5631 domain-containing protein [Mycobacterium sp.]|uniref:DUF5631 domain-containing protein n=1 Tax=Mycobacterium sp. TaxID=1785 RepID=UPI003BAF7130